MKQVKAKDTNGAVKPKSDEKDNMVGGLSFDQVIKITAKPKKKKKQ